VNEGPAPDGRQILLEARELTKVYLVGTGVSALQKASLTIRHGEFVVITGPSGCGKSTLLNLLGGLDRPTFGDVLLKGRSFASMTETGLARMRRRDIGFVFQSYNLLNDLSARENIELPLRLCGCGGVELEQRASELLEAVGLSDRAAHYPFELSGGEQQRIAVARALANRPSVVLADEPTGNLDSRNGREVMNLFRRLNRDEGHTFVVVSHDPLALDYSSRVIRMSDGMIMPEELEGEQERLARANL